MVILLTIDKLVKPVYNILNGINLYEASRKKERTLRQ